VTGLVLAGPAFAESEDEGWVTDYGVTAGATVDFYTKYIWRGQNLVDDPVLQPSAYVSAVGFTASIWGNVTLDGEKEFTELDYTLDYTTSLGVIDDRLEKVSVSAGYIYYDFPNLSSSDDSQEIYAAVAVDTLLSPSFVVYYDYDEGDGTYYEASVSHSVPLDPVELNLCATVGYNDGQWGFDSSFSAAALGASLVIPLTEWVSIEPAIIYSVALDNQYDDEFYGGFSIDIHPWN
jgi:hypothetical protein